jgi:hypothetical protein
MRKALNWIAAWLAAVIATAVVGSIVQTQFNLARLKGLGVDVGWSARLSTTAADLIGFAPIWTIIVAAGFLIALPVAGKVTRLAGWGEPFWHLLAGMAAPATALIVMDALLPVTVIAAARTFPGIALMSAGGALGGWIYVRFWFQRQKGQNLYQAAQRNRSSQAGS